MFGISAVAQLAIAQEPFYQLALKILMGQIWM
jgi:hypothetical protein